MFKAVIIIYYIFIFYMIAGISTTDILRLLSGSKHKILTLDCFCDNCGYRIPLKNQFPIFSYIANKGKCKNCNCDISELQFFQEVFLFISFMLINIITNFSLVSIILNLGLYEVYKIIIIVLKGKRIDDFVKHFFISLIFNMVLFLSVYICVLTINYFYLFIVQ